MRHIIYFFLFIGIILPVSTQAALRSEPVKIALITKSDSQSKAASFDKRIALLAEQRFMLLRRQLNTRKRLQVVVKKVNGNSDALLDLLKNLQAQSVSHVVLSDESLLSKAVVSFARKTGMFLVCSEGHSSAWATSGDSVLRLEPGADFQAAAAAAMLRDAGVGSVILVPSHTDGATQFVKILARELKEQGLDVTATVPFDGDPKEIQKMAPQLLEAVSKARQDGGLKEVGVLFVAQDKTERVLIDARRFPILHKVAWFGHGLSGKQKYTFSDEDALAFAQKVHFKLPKMAPKSKKGAEKALVMRILARVPSDEQGTVLATYDAIMMLAHLELKSADLSFKDALKMALAGGHGYRGLTGELLFCYQREAFPFFLLSFLLVLLFSLLSS